MKERIIDSIVAVSTFIAALISYLGVETKTRLINISFGIFTVLLLVLILLIWLFYCKSLPKSYSDKKVNEYLEQLYRKSGRCYIFSQGSLSWLDYGTINQSLSKKCKEKQLTVVIPEKNSKTNTLQNLNANIYTFNEFHTNNFASWSIINPTGKDAKVAIGYEKNGKHYITEYTNSNDDVLKVTAMFADVLDYISSRKNGKKYSKSNKHK